MHRLRSFQMLAGKVIINENNAQLERIATPVATCLQCQDHLEEGRLFLHCSLKSREIQHVGRILGEDRLVVGCGVEVERGLCEQAVVGATGQLVVD